ncbi:hypothetical protein V6N13_023913 [Hibiscus sabdariffa]
MNIKEWVYLNLSEAARVVTNPENWDLLFGAICWNLWLGRNAIVFDNPLEDRGTVLERNRRLQQLCLLVISSTGSSPFPFVRTGPVRSSFTSSSCLSEVREWSFSMSHLIFTYPASIVSSGYANDIG